MIHKRILFLDIDGVLNSTQSRVWVRRRLDDGEKVASVDKDFCPIAVSNLKRVLELVPEVKVVISSSWRRGKRLPDFQKLFFSLGIDPGLVIGLTPIMDDDTREDEIKSWLAQNKTKKFVILDDQKHFNEYEKKLVLINEKTGLTYLDVEKIIKHFKVKDLKIK